MARKISSGNFVLTLKLNTEKYQEDILAKRFELGRELYNCLLSKTQKRYREMIKTKKYRIAMNQIKELYLLDPNIKDSDIKPLKELSKKDLNIRKEILNRINEIRKEYGFTEYDFHSDIKHLRQIYKLNIDSSTSQKIASSLWKGYNKLFFGNGKKIHFKKHNDIYSLEGKSNVSGIRYKDKMLIWNGLKIPVVIKENNNYEYQAFLNPIAYNRIMRKFVRGKWKYYLQIVFKNNPPLKINKETGEIKHPVGNGDVGLDIGTQTIAISSKYDVKLYEIANKVQNIENQKRLIMRYMDRSKRAMNPNKYEDNGMVIKGNGDKWIFSKRYTKARNKLKSLYSKQTDIRKMQHEILANEIITQGNRILVETMNFKGLQRRSKKTEKNDNGKFKRKKRFGKSLSNKAPAMLIEIINRKLKSRGNQIIKINTYRVKASQYNHFNDMCEKKKLSQRWIEVHGRKIQRDLYSAFIIMNVENDLETINKKKCDERFATFLDKHNVELIRLSKIKTLSSMGI